MNAAPSACAAPSCPRHAPRPPSYTLSPRAVAALVRLALHARPNGLRAVTRAEREAHPWLLPAVDELLAMELLGIPRDVVRAEGEIVVSLEPAVRGGL